MKNDLFMNELCRIAQKAGEAIMLHYRQPVDVERKADRSPVTQADRDAHDIIERALQQLTPDIHIISEEHTDHVVPEDDALFWLVDPLDGTKSFIRGESEFTVNIALIDDGVPVMGVIYIPAEGMMYAGSRETGAWRQRDGGARELIHTRAVPQAGYAAVVSLSHLDPDTEHFLREYKIATRVQASSSLKFCRVAEGEADLYPRFGPTMEWDTAAGHAIILAVGGRVENPDGSALIYGKETLRNGAFIVYGR